MPLRASVVPFLAAILLFVGCTGSREVAYKQLTDDDPVVRQDAALRLGQARAADGVDSLIAVLGDPEEQVRVQVILSLGQIGDKKATAAVAKMADESSSAVRMAVAQSLGMLKDPSSVPTLEKLLQATEGPVRMSAARALGEVPGDESVDALLRVALRDEDEMVRQHVVQVVGDRRVRDAIPKLEGMLGAEAEIVRANAAKVLGEVGDRSTLPALIHALDDPFWKVRSLAAHSIGTIDPADPEAREALRRRLDVEKHQMTVVDLAWVLAKGGDPSALGRVRELLFKGQPEDIRAEAALALGEVGTAEDLPLLQKALSDKKGLVRQEAYKASQKLKQS